jgi:glutathione S-transferase
MRVPDMQLIGSHARRFVRIVLARKRIDYEFIADNPHDEDSRASDFNPLGMVLALVTDGGAAICGWPCEATEPWDAALA